MSDLGEKVCEVLILGGGPAGFTAALYAARAGLDTLVLSPGELTGMMSKAPTVGNFPGQDQPRSGREILAIIRRQALDAGARHELTSVTTVDFSTGQIMVAAGRDLYIPQALIIATGAMGRADKLPGEEEFEGRGICRCVACDGPLYKGEDVLVVGEDEQAGEETLALAGLARRVTLVTPTPRLNVPAELQQALASYENVTVENGLRLAEIVGDQVVTGAVFLTHDGSRRTIEAPGVFLYLRGAAPATDFLEGALATDGKGYLLTDELGLTSQAGVYAAGDVRSKQVRQQVVAAAEGACAALAAEKQIRRRETMRWDRGPASV
ncbi:MAG TPA: FAD-dependent oxidoreductase [Armatimonadota bacterium]|jgi:thioredoxin reductase (NADPH)